MDKNLVLWYKFDPTDVDPDTKVVKNYGSPSSDVSGDAVFSFNGTSENSAMLDENNFFITTDVKMSPGSFYNYNFTNDTGFNSSNPKPYITLPSLTLKGNKEFTIAYWFKRTRKSTDYNMSQYKNASISSIFINAGRIEGNQKDPRFRLSGVGTTYAELYSKTQQGAQFGPIDVWMHICMIHEYYFDSVNNKHYRAMKLFVNGTLENIKNGSSYIETIDHDTNVSPTPELTLDLNNIGDQYNHFEGYINDYRFYTRALDINEIQRLAYTGPNLRPSNIVSVRKDKTVKIEWDEPEAPVSHYDITYVDENAVTQKAVVNTNSFLISNASNTHEYDIDITANANERLTPHTDNLLSYLFTSGYDSTTGAMDSNSSNWAVNTDNSKLIHQAITSAGEFTIHIKDFVVNKSNGISDPMVLLAIPVNGVYTTDDGSSGNASMVIAWSSNNRAGLTDYINTYIGIQYNNDHNFNTNNGRSFMPNFAAGYKLMENKTKEQYGNIYKNVEKNNLIISVKGNKFTYIMNGTSTTRTFDNLTFNQKDGSYNLIPTVSGENDRFDLFYKQGINNDATLTRLVSVDSVKFYTKYVESITELGIVESNYSSVTVPASIPTIFPPFTTRITSNDNTVSLSKLSEDDLTDTTVVGSTLTAKRATSKTLIKDFMKGFKSTIGSKKLKLSKDAILPGYSLTRDVFVFNAAQTETDLSDSLVSEINFTDAFGKDFYVIMNENDSITIPSHDDTVQIVKNANNTYTLTNSLGSITKGANSIYQYNGLILNLGSVLGHLTDIICFREGTKVLCYNEETQTEYEKTIESIKPGMYLKTYKHGYKKVELMNSREIRNPGDEERSKNRLYKLEPSQYPELKEPLYLTGCHALLVDRLNQEQKTQVKDTLGNIYITDDKYRLPAMHDPKAEPFADENKYTVWHVCLEQEDPEMNYGIYVNGGLLTETCSKRNMLLFNEEMKK